MEDKKLQDATKEVNNLVTNALKALELFSSLNQEQVDYIVAKASVAALDQHGVLAKMAVDETKRGVFEDKATKNLFACEHVTNSMRKAKTVGIISECSVTGVMEIAEPVGVVAGLTPVTNPTSTTIFKALISLKTRNPIIFAFHPSAQQCSKEAARIIKEAAVKAGAPENCISWIETPSMQGTNALMNHDGVATILATGGNAMVKAAYSCGKPALGVGAGNVPAYMEKTCNIKQAVHDIVMSKAFDNGMICASEQAVIIDKEIYDKTLKEFDKYHAHMATADQKKKLEAFVFGVTDEADLNTVYLNSAVVGKSSYEIAKMAGFEIPQNTSVILVKCSEVGIKEPMTREKLSPILAVVQSNNTSEGLNLSKQMVEFHGMGHTAAIHTANKEVSKEFAMLVPAIRIVENSPSTFGGIGDVYNSFMPSLTLGCGSYGRNSVSGNVSAYNLLNIKKVGSRRNNMQWFKVPPKIYFERNSVQYLAQTLHMKKAFIVTDKTMVDLGFIKKITDQLNLRQPAVSFKIFSEVLPDPTLEVVKRGAEQMRSFEPDTIIAVGGGSPLDAAKGMWLFYEQPDVDFADLKQKFMDVRKRAFQFPNLGQKAQLICVPTTSGTGSEVTPFTVITDEKENKKYPLADYALTPNIAIIDPEFTMTMPKSVVAMTGMDVLTHATEAYVSTVANDYSDGLALKAIQMVFEYLERSYNDADSEAREKMHNASAIAGMAFANAFLGITHSMAHKVGGEFHVPHGVANAVLLPFVIRYNGQKPAKLSTWPKYTHFQADEKYAQIAKTLGLPSKTVEEGVESYAKAVGQLGQRLGIKMNFEQQGINKEEYMAQVEKLAYLAFEDQCTPANPRLALVEDLKDMLTKAYDSKEFLIM